MTRHHLKTWPGYFREVKARTKTFEARKDDRGADGGPGFVVGDWLRLEEWDPETQAYTGEWILVEVTYIMRDERFVAPGHVVMGFVILAESAAA